MSKKKRKKNKCDTANIALVTTILNLVISAIELINKILN